MVLTQRILKCNRLSEEERVQFRLFIRIAPWLYAPILSEIERTAFRTHTLVDVACGDGYMLDLLGRRYPHLKRTGTDIDPYFIERAQTLYGNYFQVQDAYELNLQADMITCNLALHHFDEPSRLVQQLYGQAKQRVIIADQVRPNTESELRTALLKRKEFIGSNDVPYYAKNERKSITEAYNKTEVNEIFQAAGRPYTLHFFNNDYYERFVAVLEK